MRIARSVGRAAATARVAARTVVPIDSNPVPAEWRHVTKVDPERQKRLPFAYPLYLRHTDAISVGGSRDVTRHNTEATFELLEYAPTPAFHEPSAASHVTDETRDRAAFIAVPEVLNGNVDALVGELGAGIEYIRDELASGMIDDELPWAPQMVKDRLAEFAASWILATANFEAYVIQNPDSAAAREAGVTETEVLDADEAARRAMAAERRLGSEIVYVEYSGTYGGKPGRRLLEAIDDATNWSRVWYGGGIDSRETATGMLRAGADAVVVGDAFHDVAEEEADLADRALSALDPGAERSVVRRWLTDAVDRTRDRDRTLAARYLSTIPSVADPGGRAVEYLTTGVRTRLAIERLAGDAGDVRTADELRSLLRRRGVPCEEDMADLGDRGRAYARAGVLAVLGARLGIDADGLPVDHLGVTARLPTPGSKD
jgi:phosphoglycerol geranylgeranyltransferase